MKVSTAAITALAAASPATASWLDWSDPDTTVTNTVTQTHTYCPCNGEVQYTPVDADSTNVVVYTTQAGANFAPAAATTPAGRTITKAGPVVVVFETEGTTSTKTGLAIELIIPPIETEGTTQYVTKTVWTGAQPTNDLEWVDWDDSNEDDGATLTRTHTQVTTLYEAVGAFPTETDDASWADWAAGTTETEYHTFTTETSVTITAGSSTNAVGPIGGSTTSASPSSSTSNGNAVGPIGASTSSSTHSVGPIYGNTTTTSATTTSTSSTTLATTTTSATSVLAPISASATTSTSLSSTSVSSSSSTSTTSTTSSSTTTTSTTSTSTTSTSATAAVSSSSSSSTSSTTTTTTTTSTTTSSGSLPTKTDNVTGDDYQTGILFAHNVHRANHSAADLVWDDTMAAYAAETAAKCVYQHDLSPGSGETEGSYGQNIGAGYTSTHVPIMIGNDMYNAEMPNYPTPYGEDNPDTSNFGNWGHFSQIVWKATTGVGCATQYCATLENAEFTNYFTVCNYYPAGNVGGEYSNVGAPLGKDVVVIEVDD